MILEWLPTAIEDRKNAFSYIEADSPRAAAHHDTKLVQATVKLVDFPHSGRSGRVAGTRELVVNGSSYLVVYRIVGDRIEIVRLFHAAQAWPKDLD